MENEARGDIQVSILDMAGQELFTNISDIKTDILFEKTIPVKELAKGMYILKIQIGEQIWIKKLVK